MNAVVIDASAGAEIVVGTRRGRTLAGLVPVGVEGWVPEHFYAEVLGVLRRQLLVEQLITEAQAAVAIGRLHSWHLHRASVVPLLDAAWAYRHNMTASDALYVALSEQLDAGFLTDDHRLAASPTFPASVQILRILPRS